MVQETETQTTMLLTASENENNIPKTTNNAPTDYGESNAIILDEGSYHFLRYTMIVNNGAQSVKILRGTRVRIISKLASTEYLIFSKDHTKNFVCSIDNLSKEPIVYNHFHTETRSIGTSTHTSDYFLEPENPRADDDHVMPTDSHEKVIPDTQPDLSRITENPILASSSPIQNHVTFASGKRKEADSTMITRQDTRKMRRNSLAFYSRRISKARRKIKKLDDTIKSLQERSNNATQYNETIHPTNSTQLPQFGDESPVSSDDDNEDSSCEEIIHKPGELDDCNMPPSTSHFLSKIYSAKDVTMSKETENALKSIRMKPSLVPRITAYNIPVAFFLCRILYNFALKQGLHQIEFLNRWIFHAFPEANQEKVHYYLGEIQSKHSTPNLLKTLRELARRLSPDECLTMQTIQPRGTDEGLLDLLIRLKTDITIVTGCNKHELPNMIFKYIRNSEQNSAMGIEFRRELLRHRGKITMDKLNRVAEHVDRLIKPVISNNISNFQQSKSNTAVCELCQDTHSNMRENGTPWPSCKSCMYTTQQYEDKIQKMSTYNKPRQTARIPFSKHSSDSSKSSNCCDCNVTTRWNPRSRRPYLRCYDCYQKFRRNQNVNNYRQTDGQKQHSMHGNIRSQNRSYANVTKRAVPRVNRERNINDFRTNRRYNPKCYRLLVRVQNKSRTASITGLFDTGCNIEVISRRACRELRIDHLIKPCNRSAKVVDGKEVKIVGKVNTTVFIGKVPYTSEFSVIDHIHGDDMMVGTKFMEQSGILNDIFQTTQNMLGEENVTKGN